MAGGNTPTIQQLPGSLVYAGSPHHLVHTVDFSSATYNTVATHEVFTVSGAVRVRLWNICTETLTDAADLATIQYGIAGTTDAFILATNAAGLAGDTISANEFWLDATPADTYAADAVLQFDIAGGLDIGYEIAGEALTDGTIEFHCQWEPLMLSTASLVVLGAGGAL